jgi:hypothetical protein
MSYTDVRALEAAELATVLEALAAGTAAPRDAGTGVLAAIALLSGTYLTPPRPAAARESLSRLLDPIPDDNARRTVWRAVDAASRRVPKARRRLLG